MAAPIVQPAISKKQREEEAALIDEFVEVRAKYKAWAPAVNPHLLRFQVLSATLLQIANRQDAAAAPILDGVKYKVPVTACERVRSFIDLPRLVKKLGGLKWLLANVKPTLAAVDKAIPDLAERSKYISETRSGGRTIGEPVLRDAR